MRFLRSIRRKTEVTICLYCFSAYPEGGSQIDYTQGLPRPNSRASDER